MKMWEKIFKRKKADVEEETEADLKGIVVGTCIDPFTGMKL